MDITSIFKSKTRRALFQLYFADPEKQYYLRELERLLNIPVSMIRKELTNLRNKGIYFSSRRGNLTFFSLNKNYLLYDELKNIIFKTIGFESQLKKIIKKFDGIKASCIFGTFVQNNETLENDIDLLILGDIDSITARQELSLLEKTSKRKIYLHIFSEEDFQKKKENNDLFVLDLLENPRIFLVGNETDL